MESLPDDLQQKNGKMGNLHGTVAWTGRTIHQAGHEQLRDAMVESRRQCVHLGRLFRQTCRHDRHDDGDQK
jgi:hypothetical protein